jgi:predicted SnoaL-like aldol condensation-catalyzing enzyme
MFERNLNTVDAGEYAKAAAISARYYNSHNKMTHSGEAKRRAMVVEDMMRDAYSFDDLYVNYRKNFIAVKASNGRIKNPKIAKGLREIIEAYGMILKSTPQGVIVQINRVQ